MTELPAFVAELEALEAQATPGPWRSREAGTEYLICDAGGVASTKCIVEQNADLIVALRNAAPALLALARELKAERDEERVTSGRYAESLARVLGKIDGIFRVLKGAAEWMPMEHLEKLTNEIGEVMDRG